MNDLDSKQIGIFNKNWMEIKSHTRFHVQLVGMDNAFCQRYCALMYIRVWQIELEYFFEECLAITAMVDRINRVIRRCPVAVVTYKILQQ
jgi:hypothetical protein